MNTEQQDQDNAGLWPLPYYAEAVDIENEAAELERDYDKLVVPKMLRGLLAQVLALRLENQRLGVEAATLRGEYIGALEAIATVRAEHFTDEYRAQLTGTARRLQDVTHWQPLPAAPTMERSLTNG